MKLNQSTILGCPKYNQGILHLKGLSLIDINIIPDVINASQLKQIYIQNNLIKSLGDVAKYCWGIQKLSASTNFLSSWKQISCFADIIDLNISTNRFSEIGDMSHMTNLKYLNLEHNQICLIDKLPQNLEILKVGWNNLSNLNFVTCQNLIQLHASNNKIKHLSRLAEKCKNMKVLDMSYNMISKDQQGVLQVLLKNQLTKVNILSFEGNQISMVDNFVLQVLKYIQPDRVNCNLITPFLKNTFKNIQKNNLDDFLSMVETDYAVNIKQQYQQKSNMIRNLNKNQKTDMFDDFKQLNKAKMIKFVEEMQKGNTRRKDNEMMNLYKQMKVRNRQQQQIQRNIKQIEEDKKQQQRIKNRESQRIRQQKQKIRQRQQLKININNKSPTNKGITLKSVSNSSQSLEDTESQPSQSNSNSEYQNSQQSQSFYNSSQNKTITQSDFQTQQQIPKKEDKNNKILNNIQSKYAKNKPEPPSQSKSNNIKQNKQNLAQNSKQSSNLKKKQNPVSQNKNKPLATTKTVRTVDPQSQNTSQSDGISSDHPSDMQIQSDDDLNIYDDRIWKDLRRHYRYY